MNKGGFSWKRLAGISRLKATVSRKTGIPVTRSGRQRKVGALLGCLLPILGTLLFIGVILVAL